MSSTESCLELLHPRRSGTAACVEAKQATTPCTWRKRSRRGCFSRRKFQAEASKCDFDSFLICILFVCRFHSLAARLACFLFPDICARFKLIGTKSWKNFPKKKSNFSAFFYNCKIIWGSENHLQVAVTTRNYPPQWRRQPCVQDQSSLFAKLKISIH